MSSPLQFDFPDRLTEFRQCVLACQTQITEAAAYDASIREAIQHLDHLLQTQVLTLPAHSFPADRQSQWFSITTEIQRTLRLMTTESSFWQMARSGDRQRHYQARLLAHCQQLADFTQAIELWTPKY